MPDYPLEMPLYEYAKSQFTSKSIDFSEKSISSPLYDHITCYIHSVEDFFRILNILNNYISEDIHYEHIIYRGMSDENYNLLPSLWRLTKFDDETEHDIISEFLTLRPEAFSNLSSSFDILSKMQHYGLPTRLLDFTFNPLVALYFACEQSFDRNGRIICHFASLSSLENSVIEAICNIPMNPDYPYSENYPIEHYISNSVPLIKYISRTVSAQELPIIAKPLYWNQRIINQSAVFMVYPDQLRDRSKLDASFYSMNKERGTLENGIYRRPIGEIESILSHEPNLLKDDDENLTYDYWHDLRSIYKTDLFERIENIPNVLKNRFFTTNENVEISAGALHDKFISIVVEKNSKSQILRELSTLGINQSFIYPELEYTAKQIKSRYM